MILSCPKTGKALPGGNCTTFHRTIPQAITLRSISRNTTRPSNTWSRSVAAGSRDSRRRHAVKSKASADDRHEEEEEDESDGDTFFRFVFEGILQASIIVGTANLIGDSSRWNWDVTSETLQTSLTYALPPTLLLLAACIPSYPKASPRGALVTDNDILRRLEIRSETAPAFLEPLKRNLSLDSKPEDWNRTISSTVNVVKVFLAKPWYPKGPIPFLGLLAKKVVIAVGVECLLRGTLIFGLYDTIKGSLGQADSSSWLFWPRVIGIATEDSAMPAAVLLATLLLIPMSSVQVKILRNFTRAVVNKPIRDRCIAAMADSTSAAEFSQKIQSISRSTGASPSALIALLSDAQLPLPGSKQDSDKPGQLDANDRAVDATARALRQMMSEQPSSSNSSSTSSSSRISSKVDSKSSSSEIAMLRDMPVRSHISKDTQEQLLRAETETAAAFESLKQARTPAEVDACALALLHAATTSGEVAMNSMIDTDNKRPKSEGKELLRQSNKAQAALNSIQALRASRMQLEVLDLTTEVVIEQSQQAAEFEALMQVETPEDRLAGQMLRSHLVACTVATNLAFLATGSLAVSFGTVCVVRLMPLVLYHIWNWYDDVSLAEQEP